MFRWSIIARSLLLGLLALEASAQDDRQRLLDTLVATGGVVPGWFTANGDHVLRMQANEVLQLRGYDPDGVPLWATAVQVQNEVWSSSKALGDGGDGALMVGALRLEQDGAGTPQLVMPALRVLSAGQVAWARVFRIPLDSEVLEDLQPAARLLRSSDGGWFVVIGSTAFVHPRAHVVKLNDQGQMEWVRGIGGMAWTSGAAWGSADVMLSPDQEGGLFISRYELFEERLYMLRMNASGAVIWHTYFGDIEGYALAPYDIATDLNGDLLLLGRVEGIDQPSGGLMARFSSQGEALEAFRYQWDVGTRLHVLPDGSMLAVKEPWLYRMDATGAVLWARSFQSTTIEAEQYLLAPTNMEVAHGRLWVQGVLRRILLQFNTQRLLPAFMDHPLDAIEGCQWETAGSFSRSALDAAAFVATALPPPEVVQLEATMEVPELLVSEIPFYWPASFCAQLVSVEESTANEEGPLVLGGSLSLDGLVVVQVPGAGRLEVCDTGGRVLRSEEMDRSSDRHALQLPAHIRGMLLLRWVARDGSAQRTGRVMIP